MNKNWNIPQINQNFPEEFEIKPMMVLKYYKNHQEIFGGHTIKKEKSLQETFTTKLRHLLSPVEVFLGNSIPKICSKFKEGHSFWGVSSIKLLFYNNSFGRLVLIIVLFSCNKYTHTKKKHEKNVSLFHNLTCINNVSSI